MKYEGKGKGKSATGNGVEHGLTEKTKFDVRKSPRSETNEMEQRPVANKESITSDRGTFKTK